jgi:hypothetical protein
MAAGWQAHSSATTPVCGSQKYTGHPLSAGWPVQLPNQGKPGYMPSLSAYSDFLQEFPEPLISPLQQFVQSFSQDSHHRHPLQ